MFIERPMREKLSALSKSLWNRPNAWRKLLEKAYQSVDDPRFNVKVKVCCNFTPSELLEYLEGLQRQVDEYEENKKKALEAKEQA